MLDPVDKPSRLITSVGRAERYMRHEITIVEAQFEQYIGLIQAQPN